MSTIKTNPEGVLAGASGTVLRALAAAVLLAGTAASPAGAVECVKPSGAGPCFATIQEAVDAASPGETVRIYPGDYHEAVNVGTAGLTIAGMGPTPGAVRVWVPGGSTGFDIASAASGVTIRNVKILGGETGVYTEGAGTRLVNLVAKGANGRGLYLLAPAVLVRNCLVEGTGNDGITAGYGSSDDLTVLKSAVRVAMGVGMRLSGERARVLSSRVAVTQHDAVYMDNAGGLVRGTTVVRSSGAGLDFDETAHAIGNRVENTSRQGIAFGAVIRGNRVAGAAWDGFSSSCSSAPCRIENNVSRGSGLAGFQLIANLPGTVVAGNRAVHSRFAGFDFGKGNVVGADVTGNAAVSNGSDGFFVNGADNRLAGNLAAENRGSGIADYGTGEVLLRNRALGNRVHGFDVGMGDGLLVGNIARGNVGTGIAVQPVAANNELNRNVALGNGVDFCDQSPTTSLGTGPDANIFGTTCTP